MEQKRYARRGPYGHNDREPREPREYIFGRRAVIEAIEAGNSIDCVLLRNDLSGELAKELLQHIRDYGIVSRKVPVEKLNRITRKNHQGVVAMISPVEYYPLDRIVPELYEQGKTPLLLLLDGVTDTRNFGAMARTAECAGADAIVIPQHGSVSVTPEAVKTSAGALFNIPVCRVASMTEAVRYLHDNGYHVTGASEKGACNYTDIDFRVPSAIVMGAEDTGISDEVLRLCDDLGAIPIRGTIGSLNVGAAAAVIIYEAVRQRLAED